MTDYTKRRICSVDELPVSLRSRKGWAELFDLQRSPEPHIHQIEPTNHCPYTCVMCPRSKKMTRKLGYMDMALYHRVIDEITTFSEPVRSKEIELFHFGESLLHPELSAMVAYGAERSLKMVLSVNAPHLSPEKSEELLAAGAYKIILSLDGYDEESYRAIRGKVADYQKAKRHIDHLLQEYALTSSRTKIILRMIQLKENMDYGEQFREHWEGKGVIVELREFFPWTENDLEGLGEYHRYPPFMPCPFPWQYIAIQWDGSVVPCCRDYNGENVIANVRESSLREIWNDEPYIQFRNKHADGDFSGNRICGECMKMYYTDGGAQ